MNTLLEPELVLDPETGTRMMKVGMSQGRLYSYWLNPELKIVRRRNDIAYKKDPAKGWQTWQMSEEDWGKMRNSPFIVDFVRRGASQ